MDLPPLRGEVFGNPMLEAGTQIHDRLPVGLDRVRSIGRLYGCVFAPAIGIGL
jgi:hypothetical protein